MAQKILFGLIAMAILFYVSLPFVVAALGALPAYLLSWLYFSYKVNNPGRLLRVFALADGLKYIAALCLFVPGAMIFYRGVLHRGAEVPTYVDAVFVLAMSLAGFFYASWQAHRRPEVQRRLAGLKAEDTVAVLVRDFEGAFRGASRHGVLMVFNKSRPNEHSVEVDHLLVTPRNIYAIETKYKSGSIRAKANAPHWTVTTEHATSEMRNALIQVKNSIDTLRKSIEPLRSVRIVPIVAVVGNNVEIVDAPSNVVKECDLRQVVAAFEANADGPDIDVNAILALIDLHTVNDGKSLANHIARIKQKQYELADRIRQEQKEMAERREKAELAKIVNQASTDSVRESAPSRKIKAGPSLSNDLPIEIKYPAEPAQHNFNTLAGMQELKSQLLEAGKTAVVVAGQEGEIPPHEIRNGILLYGDPGNGKTAIAEALAGTLNLPIIKMSFGSVASKWLNDTTENVVALFRDARTQAPCVLFLDEVDSVISSREFSPNQTEESPKTTNQILTELVATRGTGVVIVMATNFYDRLDQAAIREGRVDFKIHVTAPDAAAREAIIKAAVSRAKGIEYDPTALAQAVKRWEGFSAARISAVTKEAIRQAERGDYKIIRYSDFQKAMRTLQGGLGVQIAEDTPTLEQLHMPEGQRRALMGIAKRMLSIEEVEAMGGTVPTGLLFAGPPGTGKTLAARALAKTTDWPLLTAAGADLMSDSKNIDQLIVKARNARPCIVFIDEADDVFSNRRMSSAYGAATTNKLLTAMDGVGGRPMDILWVAAVNAPETMDTAAMRGGRFTEKVWFENPDATTVSRIVEQWMGRSKAKFEATLTPAKIANLLDGESPANIQAILQQAVNIMIARAIDDQGNREVRLSDLQEARTAVSV